MTELRPVIRRQPPQIAQVSSISSTMLDVIVALLPALGMAVYLFGIRVLALTAVSVITCVVSEYVYRRLRGLPDTTQDLSACVTGLLLAMTLPVTAPYWAPVLGGVFAIVVVKQLYGGLGRNFMNPALAGRMLLTTFPGIMTNWVDAFQRPGLFSTADAVTSATPMSYLHNGQLPPQSVGQLLMGQHGGAMGSVAVMMLILGGLYLVARRVIQPRAPLAFLATVALLTFLFPQGDGGRVAWMLAQLFSGGLMLSAIFMASDYTTTPVTPRGQVLFGVGCGLLTVLLRYFGSYPDGVGWAILTMNCCVWLLDRTGMPRRFGVGPGAGGPGACQPGRDQICQAPAAAALPGGRGHHARRRVPRRAAPEGTPVGRAGCGRGPDGRHGLWGTPAHRLCHRAHRDQAPAGAAVPGDAPGHHPHGNSLPGLRCPEHHRRLQQ